MVTPYSQDFIPHPSRSRWVKAVYKWWRTNGGPTPQDVANMLEMNSKTIYNLATAGKVAPWYPELLGAMVIGWRPRQDWSRAHPGERARIVIETHAKGLSPDLFDWYAAMALPAWNERIYWGESDNVPIRIAIFCDAWCAGVVPCGLDFDRWLP